MLVTTKAIVFTTRRYGEADLIAKCFTEKSGVKTYMLRGILKSRKGKLKASLFQPLTQLEIIGQHRDKGTLEYIREGKLLNPYTSLHTDVLKSTIVMFLSEILQHAIKEEEPNPQLYSFLERAFCRLDNLDIPANFHLWFLLELTKFLGFYPDDSQEHGGFFNLYEGVFQDRGPGESCISGEHVLLLRSLLGTDFEAFSRIKINRTNRSGFLEMLINYYQIQLQGFPKPRSLSVLSEIYK